MATRRQFIVGMGTAAAGSLLSTRIVEAIVPPLYPPVDLSYFNTPIAPAPAEIRFGYASITWGGDDLKAIEDIAALGFEGIQIRSNVLAQFGTRPGDLRDLLAKHHLTFVALSSGGVKIDPGPGSSDAQVVDEHASHAKFVRDAGGLYLQVTDDRPKGRPIVAADYARLGHLLTEIGKRSADLGVPLGYHNHMNSLGEKPDEVDRILDAADPRYVKLELDVAHCLQGGGDPVKAIRRYHDRLLFLHIKDVESPAPGKRDDPKSYRFVELGRGRVDLPAVFAALRDERFRGWAVVELDSVPDKARTPKEAGAINRKYLEEHGYLQPVRSH
jgi:inosose dehydratase